MILFLAHRASYSNSNARHSWDCASVRELLKEDGFMPRGLPGGWKTSSRRRMREGDTPGVLKWLI